MVKFMVDKLSTDERETVLDIPINATEPLLDKEPFIDIDVTPTCTAFTAPLTAMFVMVLKACATSTVLLFGPAVATLVTTDPLYVPVTVKLTPDRSLADEREIVVGVEPKDTVPLLAAVPFITRFPAPTVFCVAQTIVLFVCVAQTA